MKGKKKEETRGERERERMLTPNFDYVYEEKTLLKRIMNMNKKF